MLRDSPAFSGFSVDDVSRVRAFYAETLGLDVEEQNGMLTLHLADGRDTLVYPKGDGHVPAEYTVLNFPVPDVGAAARDLAGRGVTFERYEGFGQDEDGVMRGQGPDIAWFKDTAGNVLSIIAEE
jgi:catechol 2,3-dioxygenase-like lactoylglutathione lyase family enzyme